MQDIQSLISSSKFYLLLATTVVFAAASLAPSAAPEPDKAPHENYRVLEWADLVPEGWEPPIVVEAFDEMSVDTVGADAVVAELDGQLSALPGYLKPITFNGNRVSEFLLVPFLPHQVTTHAHLEPNQMVYVFALEPIVVEEPYQPLWVVGTLSLEPIMTAEGPVAYRLLDAVTTTYEY